MWKSFVIVLLALPLSLLAFIIGLMSSNWKAGILYAAIAAAIAFLIATILLLRVKEYSLIDVFLPIPVAAVWALLLLPLKTLIGDGFSAAFCIGASFLLTICLWRIKTENIKNRNWIIFPVIVFIYEMLPVSIPGPFDDVFGFSGSIANTILLWAKKPSFQQISERKSLSGDDSDDENNVHTT